MRISEDTHFAPLHMRTISIAEGPARLFQEELGRGEHFRPEECDGDGGAAGENAHRLADRLKPSRSTVCVTAEVNKQTPITIPYIRLIKFG